MSRSKQFRLKDAGIWYLAHPVASDGHSSLKENLIHTLEVSKIVWDAGFRIIAPWHTHCLFLDDTDKEHREAGMEVNRSIVRVCRGVILTGHKLSSGMLEEKLIAEKVQIPVIDLIGLGGDQLYDRALYQRSLYYDTYVKP